LLTNFAAPTDLCNLRENFDPRARWRNAIGAARALSRFAEINGANNNKKDQLHSALMMKMIAEAEAGRRRGA